MLIIWGKNFQAAAPIQIDSSKARKLILFLHFSTFPHGITFLFLLVCWFPGLWQARSQSFLSPNVSRGGPSSGFLCRLSSPRALGALSSPVFVEGVWREEPWTWPSEGLSFQIHTRRLSWTLLPHHHHHYHHPSHPTLFVPPHPFCPTLYLTLTICRVSAKNPIRLIWNSPGERTLSFWRIDN